MEDYKRDNKKEKLSNASDCFSAKLSLSPGLMSDIAILPLHATASCVLAVIYTLSRRLLGLIVVGTD